MARYITLTLVLVVCTAGFCGANEKLLLEHRQNPPKLPELTTDQPLFAVAVLGKKASTAVWMVLDKTARDQEQYDLLHVDLNANGDLTDDGETLVGEKSRRGDMEFKLTEFQDAEGRSHKEFNVRSGDTQMISLRWEGKHKFGGGYPMDPDLGYMRFGASPDEAPVVWIAPDRPLRFQRWYGDRFKIGAKDDLQLFLGQEGVGNNSFCAFQEHVLQEGEGLVATLVYEDIGGNQRQSTFALKDKC